MTATVLLRAAFAAYLAGTLAFVLYLVGRRHGAARFGLVLSSAGAIMHAAAYGMDCATTRAMVIVTPRGMCSLLALVTAGMCLAIAARHRLHIIGAFVMPLVVTLAGVAVFAAAPAAPAVVLSGPLFPLHVWTTYLGLAGFTASFGVAVAWLVQDRELKSRHPRGVAFSMPPLDTIERLAMSLVGQALVFTGLGIATGVAYLRLADGTWWAWEPKATATVASWVFYATVAFMHRSGGWRGRRAAVLLVAGFALVLFTFAGLSHLPGPLKPEQVQG